MMKKKKKIHLIEGGKTMKQLKKLRDAIEYWIFKISTAKNFAMVKLGVIFGTAMLSVAPAACRTIWSAGESGSEYFLSNIVNLYTDKLFVLILVISGILYFAILQDDKKKDVAKKVMIGCCIAFVICKCYDLIQTTLTEVSDNFNGGTTPSAGTGTGTGTGTNP